MPSTRNPRYARAGGHGPLLQYWRKARRLSQLELALEAGISARHLSFLETGRSTPSHEMVLLLADTLDIPLRERNTLLIAAGLAPHYRETNLDATELATVREALDAMLRQQEPFPAVVMNRHWDIVTMNAAAGRFFAHLLGPTQETAGPVNVIRMMFDPQGLRPYVANWTDVARALVTRIHREVVGGVKDAATIQLLADVLAYPDVPESFRAPDLASPLVPVVPIRFRKDERTFSFFSAVTTLGTAQDVTLQELRIECFFPLDDATRASMATLALSGATPPPSGTHPPPQPQSDGPL